MNNVTLLGRLTRDPELATTNGGTKTTKFTLAVDRGYSKEREQTADFIPCVAWRSTAEFATKYLKKGSLVAVKGRLATRSWKDKEGNTRNTMEVTVENIYFAEKKVPDPSTAAFSDIRTDFYDLGEDDDGELPF